MPDVDFIEPTGAGKVPVMDVEKGTTANGPDNPSEAIAVSKPPQGQLWLQISDIGLDGPNPVVRAEFRSRFGFILESDDVKNTLNSLPELPPKTARICDYTSFMIEPLSLRHDRKVFAKHFEPYFSTEDIERILQSYPIYNSVSFELDGISRQWDERLTHHKLSSGITVKTFTARSQDDEEKSSLESLPTMDTWLKCCAIEDDKLIVFRHYFVTSRESGKSYPSDLSLIEILRNGRSLVRSSDGSRVHFTKLLILDALSLHVQDLLATIRSPSATRDTRKPDARWYTETIRHAARFSQCAESVIEAIDRDMRSLQSKDSSADLSETLLDLQFSCTRLRRLVATNLELRQRNWDLYRDTLTVGESQGVKHLTMLAAVFIPLSLSSSILAMSTRLADLHLLLYDFVGVFIILASIALLVYLLIGLWIKTARWVRNVISLFEWLGSSPNTTTLSTTWIKITVYGAILIPWAIVTTSFTVGMVRDVLLGLKILGYSFAGFLATAILYLAVLLAVQCLRFK